MRDKEFGPYYWHYYGPVSMPYDPTNLGPTTLHEPNTSLLAARQGIRA
jgi:hypothetical protein